MIRNSMQVFAVLALVLAAALATTSGVQAQDLHASRRSSPMGCAWITLDDTYVKVVYSRPYKRGRDNIFGTEEEEALVPYGQIWRTGANEATEITLTGDLDVAGQRLPAGTYSIFTTPGADKWSVHFNSALELTGGGVFADGEFTAVDLPATDVVVIEAASGSTEEEIDQFTISLEPTDGGGAQILAWIETEVRIPIAPVD